jgi:hypothetical protein
MHQQSRYVPLCYAELLTRLLGFIANGCMKAITSVKTILMYSRAPVSTDS